MTSVLNNVVYFAVYNFVLFSNWGTPSLNSFINEMNGFQYFHGFTHTVHFQTNRPESRVYESTRVSVKVTDGIT